MNKAADIAGKDFLDEQEAAHYACVSYSQFRKHAAAIGLRAIVWMGKRVYRKDDIRAAMEHAFSRAAGNDPVVDAPPLAKTGFAIVAAAKERHRRRTGRRL